MPYTYDVPIVFSNLNNRVTILSLKIEEDHYNLLKFYGKLSSKLQVSHRGSYGSLYEFEKAMEEEQRKMVKKGIFEFNPAGSEAFEMIKEEHPMCFNENSNANVKDKKEVAKEATKELVVKCINNVGVEDKYDIGVTYIAYDSGLEIFEVEDKFGKINSSRKDRFIEVDEDDEVPQKCSIDKELNENSSAFFNIHAKCLADKEYGWGLKDGGNCDDCEFQEEDIVNCIGGQLSGNMGTRKRCGKGYWKEEV